MSTKPEYQVDHANVIKKYYRDGKEVKHSILAIEKDQKPILIDSNDPDYDHHQGYYDANKQIRYSPEDWRSGSLKHIAYAEGFIYMCYTRKDAEGLTDSEIHTLYQKRCTEEKPASPPREAATKHSGGKNK